MDGGAWQVVVEQEVVEKISSLLVIDKDNGTSWWHGEQKIE